MHSLATGLFTLGTKSRVRTDKLDVTYEARNGAKVRFWGPEPLGPFDLLVLQGIVAMAGKYGHDLRDPKAGDDANRRLLHAALDLTGDAGGEPSMLFIKARYTELAGEIGIRANDSMHASRDIRKSLERLYATTITIQRDGERLSTRMMTTLRTSRRQRAVYMALNPVLSHAIVGGPFTRILMDEVRAITSDAARIIHQCLCAMVFDNESRLFSMASLAGYAYGPASGKPLTPSARSKRMARIREAMDQIGALPGWTVKSEGAGYRVKRHR